MSRVTLRPNQAVDYGTVSTTGSPNPLGDGVTGSYKQYGTDSGSILVYPQIAPTDGRFVGKEIIAVRVGHAQWNGGAFGLWNGWCMSYLRIQNARVAVTKAYKQDGKSSAVRYIEGAPLYKPALASWTIADLNTMSTDVGAATGVIGPNKDNYWCIASESYITVVLADTVPIPTASYPAVAGVIGTSSVDFQSICPAPQAEQPVAAVVQVARNNTFTDDVRTFVSALNQDTAAGSLSKYDSVPGTATYTNLGPGRWYRRIKGRDFRGVESAWGVTTYFDVGHGPLPVPTVTQPASLSISPTPYGVRVGRFDTDPSGERLVGMEWQFSDASTFVNILASWVNKTGGRFTAGEVQYDSEPDPTVTPGLFGGKVSTDDPSQYLVQGQVFARARAVDVYGQTGNWGPPISFMVQHPPVVIDVYPSAGKAYDDDSRPVAWTFGDTWVGDTQSAYQVIVRDASNNIVTNTGKVLSTVNRGTVNIPDTYLQQNMQLEIAVWDRDGVKCITNYNGSFRLSKAPIITLPYPAANEQIITGQPALTWSVVYALPGITQKSYRIDFVRRDTGVVEYSTGHVSGTATSWQAPQVVLKNLSEYQLMLTITDTDDLATTLLRNFSTNYVRPQSVVSNAYAEDYAEEGYVTVLWPMVEDDPMFIEYRVYRKDLSVVGADWELAGVVEHKDQFEFHDWLAGGQKRYRYCVTQVALRFGARVESEFDEYGDIVETDASNYWLVVPGHEELNIRLFGVVNDKYNDTVEQSEHFIIGGGRRINYGEDIGIDGSLTCQIRSSTPGGARAMILAIRNYQKRQRWVIMRDPFGNVTKVSFGNMSFARLPGVTEEFGDLELPYFEVK